MEHNPLVNSKLEDGCFKEQVLDYAEEALLEVIKKHEYVFLSLKKEAPVKLTFKDNYGNFDINRAKSFFDTVKVMTNEIIKKQLHRRFNGNPKYTFVFIVNSLYDIT